jgi:hypothetical protein
MASNADRPVHLEWDDRRMFVLAVSEAHKFDLPYFTEVVTQAEREGGLAALLADLQARSVDWALVKRPPDSAAKIVMKAESGSDEERWWRDVLAEADDSTWESKQARSEVAMSYTAWKRAHGSNRLALSRTEMGHFFARLFRRGGMDGWPRTKGKAAITDPTGKKLFTNAWEFPPLADCRRVLDKATGTVTNWGTV